MSDSEISPNDESTERRQEVPEQEDDELSIDELEEAAGGIGEPPAPRDPGGDEC